MAGMAFLVLPTKCRVVLVAAVVTTTVGLALLIVGHYTYPRGTAYLNERGAFTGSGILGVVVGAGFWLQWIKCVVVERRGHGSHPNGRSVPDSK